MKILFTGASSFTGYWFVRELAGAGHEVVMPLRRPLEQYEGVRRQRVEGLLKSGRPVFGCTFGDDAFLELIRGESGWGLLCHHAAETAHYRSPDFDVHAAVQGNTHNLRQVLAVLGEQSCRRIVLTGSFFECDEGAGSEGLPAFSPYGLSKALTATVFRYYAGEAGFRLGKFVIPNPFGPYEEPRFTMYLIRNWYAGATPHVQTPAYVRDNIPVSLLARAYLKFCRELPDSPGFTKLNPGGYAESQGAFALRFAAEMRPRLGLPCGVELDRQTAFPEPRVRLNTDVLDASAIGWDETAAWNELATYYKGLFAP